MRAVVYTEPMTVRMRDEPEPVAGPGEVVVDVRAVGLCGSELEGVASRSPFRVPPLIMGHEFAGVRLDSGERVVVNPVISCHACDLCDAGRDNVCRNRQIIGIQRPGGYAERVAVPVSNCVTIKDPAVSFRALALTEPMANAVHALRLAQQHEPWPQRIGVIGSGAIGYCLALVALDRGIPRVDITDLSPSRLARAEQIGARGMTQLDDDYDVIFDTVGTAGTRGASLAKLRPGGTAVWVGLHESGANIDGQAMIRNENRVLATFCYDRRDFTQAADLVTRIDTSWASERPLEDGADLFMSLMAETGTEIKYLLTRG